MARPAKLVLLAALAAALGRGIAYFEDRADARAEDHARGRFARSPLHMTWRGWSEILSRAAVGLVEDRVTSVAASLAFYALLSLVPALSILVSIYGLFTLPSSIPDQLATFTDLMPEAARSIVADQAVRLATQSNGSLSLTLVVSLLIGGWSANAAVKSVFESLNLMWGTVDDRSYLAINLESLLFTFAGILVAVVVLVTMAVIPGLLALLPVDDATGSLLLLVRWPILYVTGLAAIVMVYRRGPCRRPPPAMWILPGAIAASLAWGAASWGFSWYVSTLATYPATYGSLATVVVMLTWLWISAIILLAGAEIDAEIERQIGLVEDDGRPPDLRHGDAVDRPDRLTD